MPQRGQAKPPPTFKEFITTVINFPFTLRDDFRKYIKFLKARQNDIYIREHLMFEYVAKFRDMSQLELDEWLITTDAGEGGMTTASLTKHPLRGTAIFSGNLSTTVPKSGEAVRSGLASFRSPHTVIFGIFISSRFDLYNSFVIRYRGDGRTYGLNVQSNHAFDADWHDFFTVPLFTHGGPMWQTARIPFHKLAKTVGGRLQDVQTRMPSDKVRHISFTLADAINGPFHLEFDHIAVQRQENMNDVFSYEMYEMPNNSHRYK